MTPPPYRPMRIAILLNSYRSPNITEIRDSYIRTIGAVSPDSQLSFFYPADRPGHFPDPAAFDLIVIGGANADPRSKHPWILSVHHFILDVVANHPRKKLCGICWGHQTISMLFGGEVVDMETPELGVTEAKLTPAGRRFFGRQTIADGSILLQQHHRREVAKPPRGFSELIVGNQCFLSHNNTILTFQGHPEKDARCAKLRVRDAIRWFGVEEDDKAALDYIRRSMERPNDGSEIWVRVFAWARERHPSHEVHL